MKSWDLECNTYVYNYCISPSYRTPLEAPLLLSLIFTALRNVVGIPQFSLVSFPSQYKIQYIIFQHRTLTAIKCKTNSEFIKFKIRDKKCVLQLRKYSNYHKRTQKIYRYYRKFSYWRLYTSRLLSSGPRRDVVLCVLYESSLQTGVSWAWPISQGHRNSTFHFVWLQNFAFLGRLTGLRLYCADLRKGCRKL
jgi:hypothetical protein